MFGSVAYCVYLSESLARNTLISSSLNRSNDMQALCETHAPHLFYILISTIVRTDRHATNERHSHLQQQRIVVLLHMSPYFRYLLQIIMHLPKVLPLEESKIIIFYIIYTNFKGSFFQTVSAVTGTKQLLFLSMITGIICNFPQIPETSHLQK